MSDYIKELEKQNEELQQMLADAQLYMPRWDHIVCPRTSDTTDTIHTWRYMLGDLVFGYVEYREDPSWTTRKMAKCKTKSDERFGHNVEFLKRHVEDEFKSTFLFEDH